MILFFFNDTATTEIYTLSLHDALPIYPQLFRTSGGALFGIEICEDVWAPTPPSNVMALAGADLIFNLSASDELIGKQDRKSTRLNSSHANISYAVFCLKKKNRLRCT